MKPIANSLSTFMLALSLFALTLSDVRAEQSSQVDYPLGVFHFDFARLGADEASRVAALQSIGYDGMVMRVNNAKNLKELQRYQAAIGEGVFKVHAVWVPIKFGKDLAPQHEHIDQVLHNLEELGAHFSIRLDHHHMRRPVLPCAKFHELPKGRIGQKYEHVSENISMLAKTSSEYEHVSENISMLSRERVITP